MKFLPTITFSALMPLLAAGQACDAERRVAIAMNITKGFNEPDFAKSAAMINAMPLTYDCPAIV